MLPSRNQHSHNRHRSRPESSPSTSARTRMRGSSARGANSLLVATCKADDAGGVDAVVAFGPLALLFLGRGYVDPAPRARPAPRFEASRGTLGEIGPDLLVARLVHASAVGPAGVVIADLAALLCRDGKSRVDDRPPGRDCVPATTGGRASRPAPRRRCVPNVPPRASGGCLSDDESRADIGPSRETSVARPAGLAAAPERGAVTRGCPEPRWPRKARLGAATRPDLPSKFAGLAIRPGAPL